MRTIYIDAEGPSGSIDLGRQGESLSTEVVFGVGNWTAVYGAGYARLLLRRSGDPAPYPCPLIQDETTVRWRVTAQDTARAGTGFAELQYLCGEGLVKSRRFVVGVAPALSTEIPTVPAGAAETWLDQLLAKETTGARTAGENAAQAATDKVTALLSDYTERSESARTAAETAADTALYAREAAEIAQGKAEDAQRAAEAAQGVAESAREDALDAQEAAETAQGKAETAQQAAETAQGAAEDARDDAQSARDTAVQAATEAAAAAAGATVPFTAASWVQGTDDCTLTIPASAHGQTGGDFAYQLYQTVNGVYRSNTWGIAATDVRYDGATGNIVLTAPDEYAGKLVVK